MHNMVQSIRIDFVCRPKLCLHFIATAGRAYWKRGHSFTHTEVKPTLTSTSHFLFFSLPQLLNVFPHVLPHVLPQGLQPPGAAPQHHHNHHIQHHCITLHLPDKWSTLSMFSRQILSLPLAVSQPFDLSVCLHISPLLNRMPSVLGKLQARRSGSRDLEGIGKTQLNGRSCLCLTLPT